MSNNDKRIRRKVGNGYLELFTDSYEIKPKKYSPKMHEMVGKALIIISMIYVFIYSFLPSNPNYGNHASTCSNVGRDHRILFAIWGILVGAALIVNLYLLFKKYNITSKIPRVMCNISFIGIIGFITFENDKFQKYRLIFTKEQYTGKVSDPVQTFVESIPRVDYLITKKTLHTTFAIIFGLCIAFAILYCLFCLAKRSSKYKYATVLFFGYMIVTSMVLGIKLSGLTEAIAVDIAFIMLYIINYIDSINDKSIMQKEFTNKELHEVIE